MLDSAYILIQSIISQAPERYDRTIKSRDFINMKIGFAMTAIPIAVLMALLCIAPTMRSIYAHTYALYPLATLSTAVVAGAFIGANRTERFLPQSATTDNTTSAMITTSIGWSIVTTSLTTLKRARC